MISIRKGFPKVLLTIIREQAEIGQRLQPSTSEDLWLLDPKSVHARVLPEPCFGPCAAY